MLEREFLGYINDNRLFGPTDRVLLTVSGGLDSMVMTELFHRTGQLFAIAHVNFGLRGAESDEDAVFVQNKAEQCGVPFHVTRFDTATFAAGHGLSIQMAARELRYPWFAGLCRQYGYACLATAHHMNDVLETLLLNLTRGTGLAGLHGIAPKQERSPTEIIIRPLLFATRNQLAEYGRERGLSFREDRSNAEDKYARNRIRHHVVPVLTEVNPSLWQTLPRTIERFRAAETLVRAELDRSWEAVCESHGSQLFLAADKLNTQSELAFRLADWLKPYGFTADQVAQMVDSLSRSVGQMFRSDTHLITHDRLPTGRTGLLLEPLSGVSAYDISLEHLPDVPLPVVEGQFTLTFSLIEKTDDFQLLPDSAVAYLNADRIRFPLTIRPWQQGDRLRPLGMGGHKLVSDLLNDQKLTRSERERTAVILSGNQIMWVIGRRIDHRFRVTATTKKVLKITLSHHQ